VRNSSATDERLWLALYALICGGSVAVALGLALAHSVGALGWPPGAALDWSGWRTLFTTHAWWLTLAYSLALTAITLGLALLLALLLLASLGERLRAGWLARAMFVPLAVPPVVAALMAFTLLSDSGLVSRLCRALHLTATPADFPTLVFDTAGRGIVLTHLAMVTPLFVLLFQQLAAHLRLPLLLRQAEALGASRAQAWWRIALPLLLRQAQPVIAVYGLALLGAYEVPLLTGATRPAMVSVTIQRAIAGVDLAARPLGYAMASVYLSLLVVSWLLLTRRAAVRDGEQ
jgi:putative spermidine/putrescine transport system permease protein